MKIFLSNEKQEPAVENLDCISNEFALSADWLKIPYGDHPHAKAVQRLTRAIAENMVSNFKSFGARLGRFFGGLPIYVGHPDDPALSNQFPDKKAYGWIMDIEAREDGLYLKPKWSGAGEELLANAHYKWFSPFWGCRRAAGAKIVEPVRLVSLGLTNTPNIPGILPLANEEGNKQNEKGDDEVKEFLLTLLGLANEATDAQIQEAATKLKADKAAADVALANEKTARAAAETALANEKTERAAKETELTTQISNQKKARIELVLANALAAGKITPAQKPQWASDLEKDLDGKLVELSNAKPAMNTSSKTGGLGKRNSDAVASRDEATRRDRVITLVNERMQKTGEDYEAAFANIRKENTALFDEMRKPENKRP
jgi:hypothetical protein